MKHAFLLAIAGALLAGCANSNENLSQTPSVDDTYALTGSRIPRRDGAGVKVIGKEQMEQAVNSIGNSTSLPGR